MEAAKLISDSILFEDSLFVKIGNNVFEVKPPTIKMISRAIKHFSMQKEYKSLADILNNFDHFEECQNNGLASLLGCDPKELENGIQEELTEALKTAISLISPDSFFESAILQKSVLRMAVK